jgi:3-oxoacyl-[acyl-carrier protein] reductase
MEREVRPGRFAGKVVAVTGAGRNIGAEVSRRFAGEGATVAVIDIDLGRASTVVAEIATASGSSEQNGGSARAFSADVSSAAGVAEVFAEIAEHCGCVDVLVNNVAITDRESVLTLSEQEWDAVLAVSLKSTFLCAQAVARALVADARPGSIVNIASTSGHRGRVNSTAYPAAKAGVLNLTRSLALQLAPHGITVNSVTPNQIGSPVGQDIERAHGSVQNPLGRIGTPVDIAAAVLFVASAEARFVTGTDLVVDGGILAGI